jgi:very-short-patch-repair endonuclease
MRQASTVNDVVAVLQRTGGSAHFADLAKITSAWPIRQALERQQIRRVSKGVYALPEAEASDLTVARANGGILSRESAALHHGFEVLTRPLVPHVTIKRSRSRRVTDLDCVLHTTTSPLFDGSLPNATGGESARPLRLEADRAGLTSWAGMATSPLTTVLDCARFLPFGEALVIADSAIRSGKVRREDLRQVASTVRGAGRQRAIRVAEEADGRAESALESMLRARVLDAGFTGFVPQHQIQCGDFRARVDLADPVLRIVLEADSFAFHGSRGALRRDCRRHVGLAMSGWLLLRYSWEDVVLDDEWVGQSLRATIDREVPHPHLQNSRLAVG